MEKSDKRSPSERKRPSQSSAKKPSAPSAKAKKTEGAAKTQGAHKEAVEKRASKPKEARKGGDRERQPEKLSEKPSEKRNERSGGGKPKGGVPQSAPAPKYRNDGQDYTIQCYFDVNDDQYVATVLEFPDIRVTGYDRDILFEELVDLLEDRVVEGKKKPGSLPEPISTKQYPEFLELPISQNLFRRLDRLSRAERISLDTLVVELLSSGVEKRYQPSPAKGAVASQPQRSQGPRNQGQQNRSHQGGGNRQGGGNHAGGNQKNARGGGRDNQRGGGGGRNQARGFHNTMENQGSFMEYVRNLEKGYKKR